MQKRLGGKVLGFVLTLASSGGAVAQGYYELIPYYGNDPFVFCTFGVPTDCWFPINPATGTFGVWNYYCFNPVSAAQYARVCPHAFVPVGQVKSPRREIDKERKYARSGIS
ncbi:MAG: hypothetical protein KGN77_00925 [Xanthomonadaceae bacterium]|nr:hypothetical protein [Xanthomonadaceae bacterium]MDE1964045.1 hypothetical protein [Xanthomonadaceae bacterium]